MSILHNSHTRLWAISLFVIIAIVVCIICNLAIEQHMTWLVYPVCSLMFGWGVFVPLIYRGKKGLKLSLALLTALILPYLLVMEQWTRTTGWFIPIAFPIAIALIIYIWGLYVFISRCKNPWHIGSVALGMAGVLSLAVYFAILFLSGLEMFPWGWISFGSALGLSALVFAAGIIRHRAGT